MANHMKQQVAEIVAAYVGKNRVDIAELPALIATVSQSLASLGQALATTTPEPHSPAVSIRQSIRPEYLVCLDCGLKAKMLKRHLTAAHGTTPDAYRTQWGLAAELG
jgi:predicted transcriptional regulator